MEQPIVANGTHFASEVRVKKGRFPMLRGAIIWLGFCLSLIVLWRLAGAASGQERMLREAYAAENAMAVAPEEQVPLGAAARPAPRWHDCDLQPMDCDELWCDRRAVSTYSRFQ